MRTRLVSVLLGAAVVASLTLPTSPAGGAPPARTAVSPQAAAAASAAADERIVSSHCTNKQRPYHWNGGFRRGQGVSSQKWPVGRVYICWTKYRIADSDRRFDYYKMVVTTVWSHKEGGRDNPAETQQALVSNLTARGNVYESTPSFTSRRNCSDAFSVSFGVGPFSVSTSPKVCDDYRVTRIADRLDRAQWKSTRAAGLRRVQTAFVQKVRQGAVPKYDVVVAIPQYQNRWDGGAWISTKRLKWVSWSNR